MKWHRSGSRTIVCTSCLVVLTFGVVGCSSEARDVAADPDISNSFSARRPMGKADAIGANLANISIRKSALGKEFLLQANLVEEELGAPLFGGLRSRVVYFEQSGDKLHLFEAPADYAWAGGEHANQRLLLATFPIAQQTDDELTFDFNTGMTNLYYAYDWFASDFEEEWYQPRAASMPIETSLIESADVASGRLVIKQVGKLTAEFDNQAFAVVYYLSPYQPDPSYQPIRSPADFDNVAFFEVSPKIVDAIDEVVWASRFHPDKPIVFAVSTNTPADYRQAVRDGILYWNRVLGEQRLQVVDAPEGVSAPNPDYNIVQWVDSPLIGYAYADAQMDPRTGQILHGQVFLSSAWAVYSVDAARTLLRRILNEEEDARVNKPKRDGLVIGLKRFESKHFHVQRQRKLKDMLRYALNNRFGDAAVRNASQQMIREVVAHEIGHVLGLRHNFAGSLGANVSPERSHELFEQLMLGIEEGNEPDLPAGMVPSSSIMDYVVASSSVLIGKLIADGEAALPHDVKAMQVLYQGAPIVPSEFPVFCTDSNVPEALAPKTNAFPDCLPYDVGRSLAEYARFNMRGYARNLPAYVLDWYIADKVGAWGYPPVAVEKVSLDPKWDAIYAIEPLFEAFRQLTTEPRTLLVHRRFPFVGPTNEDQVRTAEQQAFAAEVERLGGVEAVFGTLGSDFVEQAAARFDALLAQNASTLGWAEREVGFSEAEQQVMRTNARAFFARFEQRLVALEMDMLQNGINPVEAALADEWGMWIDPPASSIADTELAGQLAIYIEQRTGDVMLAETGDKLEADVEMIEPEPEGELPEGEGPEGELPEGELPGDEGPGTDEDAADGEGESDSPDAEPEALAVHLSLPVYRYEQDVRVAAASVLNNAPREWSTWGEDELLNLQGRWDEAMMALLEGKAPADLTALPKPVARWFNDKDEVEGALYGGGGGGEGWW